MRALVVALVVLLAAGVASAQTNTPTSTPTLPPLVGSGSTNWSAYHTGSFRFDPGSLDANESDELTVTIPGIQLGDSIIIYPATVCADGVSDADPSTCFERGLAYSGVRIVGNNTIVVRYSNITGSAIDATAGDWEYLWFDRTRYNHVSTPNPTVTNTPTPTNTP